ncbi:MAG TPA: AMIN domain-containing protein, partial [Myxococcaceae bacterium]|nr:AMIN domain-containing protein [Myxococcaceae bacterium]
MRTQSAVTLIGCLAVLAGQPSLAGEQNVLTDVRLQSTAAGARVVVTGSKPPVFTVFRLSGPDRLVIDVASADASAVRGAREGTGPISGINVSQFTDSAASVGRILVTLKAAKSYDVKAEGNQLAISVVGEGVASGPVASAAEPAPAPPASPAPTAAPTAPVVAAAAAAVAPATTGAPAP